MGIAWETDDGRWRPMVRMMSEGALEEMVERARAGWTNPVNPSPSLF
jgi:hypothetical protein